MTKETDAKINSASAVECDRKITEYLERALSVYQKLNGTGLNFKSLPIGIEQTVIEIAKMIQLEELQGKDDSKKELNLSECSLVSEKDLDRFREWESLDRQLKKKYSIAEQDEILTRIFSGESVEDIKKDYE